ncbi:MAG: ATP-binding protein [Anaerolineaceae bacterium]
MPTQVFPANYEALAAINEFIVAEASALGFSPRELYAIELSVNEAAANIIDHSYCGEDLGTIEISSEVRQDCFTITLKDRGAPFDPDEIPEPDISSPLEMRSERGLGVFTMRQLMDEVVFDFSQPGVNTLVMTKRKKTEA